MIEIEPGIIVILFKQRGQVAQRLDVNPAGHTLQAGIRAGLGVLRGAGGAEQGLGLGSQCSHTAITHPVWLLLLLWMEAGAWSCLVLLATR